MAGDARTELLEYVTGSPDDTLLARRSPGDTTQPLSDERAKELREQLQRLSEAGGEPLSGTDDPTEFQEALAEREERAKDISLHGKDVPRWREDSRVMKPVYRAHDVVVSLPQPGGIGVLILALVILFLVLIPATTQGETRTLLLWEVLLGKKQVDDPNAPQIPVANADGSIISNAQGVINQVKAGLGIIPGIIAGAGFPGLSDTTATPSLNGSGPSSNPLGIEMPDGIY